MVFRGLKVPLNSVDKLGHRGHAQPGLE